MPGWRYLSSPGFRLGLLARVVSVCRLRVGGLEKSVPGLYTELGMLTASVSSAVTANDDSSLVFPFVGDFGGDALWERVESAGGNIVDVLCSFLVGDRDRELRRCSLASILARFGNGLMNSR
jgi:hypothetical protein